MQSILGSKVCGTYVKVIQFDESLSGDAYLIVYLLRSGLYVFIGYWRGYELTVAAGRWTESQNQVEIDGIGRFLSRDTRPFSSAFRPYKRTFANKRDSATPTLKAGSEKNNWSLLSWSGPFTYLGKFYFFALEHEDLPAKWQDIDPWVREFLGDHTPVN